MRSLAGLLRRLSFVVEEGIDLDARGMQEALQRFDRLLDVADVGLFFYAGHGLQVGGRNYLVPVDARLERESDLRFQAVEVDLVLDLLERQPRTSVVFLDACRDNPLARNLARASRGLAVGRGLAQTTRLGIGTLIVYATQPDNVALDGPRGSNSPFTRALLQHLNTPGLEIGQMLRQVRKSVIEETDGEQVPWDHSSLTGDFYFVAAPEPRPLPNVEVAFWNSVRESRDPADLHAYLKRFPQGMFVDLARNRLAALERMVAEVSPAPPVAPAGAEPAAETAADMQVAGAPPVEASAEPPTSPADAEPGSEAAAPEPEAAGEPEPAPAPPIRARNRGRGRHLPPEELAPGTVFRDCSDCPELVVVPAGPFRIGSPTDEVGRENDEGPMVEVTVERPFAIGIVEVTFAQWEVCVAAGACARRPDDGGFGRGRQPVMNVALDEVEAYLAWLGRSTGRSYRLPSEAEWEYAARAGSTSRYSWGEEIGERQANCDGCLPGEPRRPRPVGSYAANAFGLFDMLGNVWEWTADCWNDSYEPARTTSLARGDGNCLQRAVRGGSWASRPTALRSANRDRAFTTDRSPYRGFRVVRELPGPTGSG